MTKMRSSNRKYRKYLKIISNKCDPDYAEAILSKFLSGTILPEKFLKCYWRIISKEFPYIEQFMFLRHDTNNSLRIALQSNEQPEMISLLIDLLLKYGADPNSKDDNGNTPLHVAMKCMASYGVIDLLFKYGADPNSKNNGGNTPFYRWYSSESDVSIKDLYNCTITNTYYYCR